MEFLEIVSENNVPLGVFISRAEALQKRLWCRSTNIFVVNSSGELLCHKRALKKERLPGVWMTHVGGHVSAGESYQSNAKKELAEELGVDVHASRLIAWRTTRHEPSRLWMRDFVVLLDMPAESMTPQQDEVAELAWRPVSEILHESRNHAARWCAGAHDLATEYHCLRSALVVAHHHGICEVPERLHTWSV